jgi:AraC-like DNA-binding protein
VRAPGEEWVAYDADRTTGIERMRARFVHHAYDRHAHETYAIGMTEAGSQTFTCRGVRHATEPGAIMLFNPTDLHDGRATTGDGFIYRMLYVPVAAVRRHLGREPVFARPMAVDRPTARLVATLYDVLGPEGSALDRDDRMLRLLVRLAARYAGVAEPMLPGGDDRAVLRVRDRLHDAPGEETTLDELAALAGMSRFQLTRLFQRRFGLAPSIYLRLLRLERAKQLLAAGEAPAAVAASLGFADQAHLTRRFKAAYGLTPGRYRASRLAC